MKKFLLSILVLTLSISSCLFIPKTNNNVKASSADRFIIQAYGDSISYGEKLEDKNDAYPNVFAQYYVEKYDAEFYANGVSGDTTTDLLELLQPYKDKTASETDMTTFEETDIVVLCIGANNVLGPAITSISSYVSGGMSEEEFRNLLQENVDKFKLEYPEILDIFENKKIIAMTVYNPYKFSSLKDIQIDSSINSGTATLLKSLINNYDVKFQEMLNISMEYLNLINDEIKTYSSSDFYVVDIWNLFSTFNKTQYQDYINSNPSDVIITNSDVSNIFSGNTSSLMHKLYTGCDPHPTKAGHALIAQKHLEKFKLLNLDIEIETQDNNSIISIDTILSGDYTFKFYKMENNKKILLQETNQKSITVQNTEIENASDIFVEVYANNTLLETSDNLSVEIEKVDTEKPVEETKIYGRSIKGIFIIIFIFVIVSLMTALIPIIIYIYKKNTHIRF